MGKSSLSEEQLRQQIRVRLARGRLPPIVVGANKAHRGRSRLCLVCRHEIGPTETEYEIDGAGVVLLAHEFCHTLWSEESVSRRQENRP